MNDWHREILVLPERPASWVELSFAFLVGLVIGVILTVTFAAGVAHAGGPVVVTWNQSADCAAVTGWELAAAPITTTKPNPVFSDATLAVSIANTAPVACGPAATKTVLLTGVGSSRYWLTAVAGTTKSNPSNNVDASLPLAAPSGLQVVPQ